MSSAVASLGVRSDDSFLHTSNEVASCFLSLYLEPEKTSLVDRSPSQEREGKRKEEAGASVAGGQQPTVALEVAERLKRIGDEINAKVTKELSEATADLLRQQSVFQIGLKQFRGMCRRVLTKCSGQLHTGWEQMTVVYLGMGELVRELRRQDSQLSSARERQFQQFAGQVMEEVGLQRWVMQQGGIRMVMRAGEPLDLKDSSQPKVDISDVD